jgi:hypothetical protein
MKTMFTGKTAISLFQKGITDAGGSARAMRYLAENDLYRVGRTLAERETKIASLISFVINPINSIALAIKPGGFSRVDKKLVLHAQASAPKRIYFLPITEHVDGGQEEAYANTFGLRLCRKSQNYLLGAMAFIPKHALLSHCPGGQFIAAEKRAFQKNGSRSFLRVAHHRGKRILDSVTTDGGWSGTVGWYMLTEKAPSAFLH